MLARDHNIISIETRAILWRLWWNWAPVSCLSVRGAPKRDHEHDKKHMLPNKLCVQIWTVQSWFSWPDALCSRSSTCLRRAQSETGVVAINLPGQFWNVGQERMTFDSLLEITRLVYIWQWTSLDTEVFRRSQFYIQSRNWDTIVSKRLKFLKRTLGRMVGTDRNQSRKGGKTNVCFFKEALSKAKQHLVSIPGKLYK